MGLKLTVGVGDKVICSNGVVIDVRTTSDKQTQLEFTAPPEVKIDTIFRDSNKMFKNRRKNDEDDSETNFNK